MKPYETPFSTPHSHCETWCWHVTTTKIPPMRTHNHPKPTQTRYGRGGGTPSPRGVRVAGLRCACATGARRASMLPSKKRGAIPPPLGTLCSRTCADRDKLTPTTRQDGQNPPPHTPILFKTNKTLPPNGREGVARRRASWRLGEENGVVRHLNTIHACYKAWNINIILFKLACKQN